LRGSPVPSEQVFGGVMALRARTLAVSVAALFSLVMGVQAAGATQALVRVELPENQSQFASFVNRQAVTVGVAPLTKAGRTCAADSAAAALSAAIGDVNWEATDNGAGLTIGKLKNVTAPAAPANPPGAKATWTWATFVDQHYVADPCTASVPDGSEVLFFPACATRTGAQLTCFTGGPLYVKVNEGTPYPTKPFAVGGGQTFVSIWVVEDPFDPNTGQTSIEPSTNSVITTDEGYSAPSNDAERRGIAVVRFTEWGDHALRATEVGKVPGRAAVCATDGADGYCGTTKPDFNAFDVGLYASPCTTNGRDGFCGTTDTSGPVSHITNVVDQQKFKKKKGPGQIVGSLDPDPNAVKDVKLRLTRVVTTRVAIKAKKKKSKASRSAVASAKKKKAKTRYRTVKRCTAWDDGTALLETAKCGTRYGKWFPAELNDLRNAFTYSFALTLPAGSYVLEVVATDENGFKDATAAGRNVLSFTVL
jgi:hypothetical protein